MNIGELFEKGKIATEIETQNAASVEFIPHKAFKGVSLKHLVKGEKTNNQISCHLVKVEPNCILDTHTHTDNLEIHEVISGSGTCFIGKNRIEYTQGTLGVIPAKTVHKVVAGKDGIYILAKFSPALL